MESCCESGENNFAGFSVRTFGPGPLVFEDHGFVADQSVAAYGRGLQ